MINHTERKSIMDFGKYFINEMRKVREASDKISQISQIIRNQYEIYNANELKQSIVDISKLSLLIYKKCAEVSSYIPTSGYNRKEITELGFSIKQEGNTYHIIMKDLLPHKIIYNSSNGKNPYSYNKDIEYSRYRLAIEEYLKDQQIEMYQERIAVLFIHFYKKDDRMVDYDNLHTKTFIDAVVKGIFIRDDSPAYFDLYQTYRTCMDKTRHTEVYIGKIEDIKRKL